MPNITPRDPFEAAFPAFFRSVFGDHPMASMRAFEEGALAVDVSEAHDGETIVRASLPGFAKEDVHVSVHNGVLDIKAEHREETEQRDEKFYRRERRIGSVSRRVALPGNPKEDDVQATLTDGVLTVRVRPSTESGPRRISIS